MKQASLIVFGIVTFISGFMFGIHVPMYYWILSLVPITVALCWCLIEIDD